MISTRLCWTHQALQRIAGGRHARRPCFDFGTPTYRGSDWSSDVTGLVVKGLARLVTPGGARLFSRDIAANAVRKEHTIVMALNKLSIDKVELADKRVLIRYVCGSLDKISKIGGKKGNEKSAGHAQT